MNGAAQSSSVTCSSPQASASTYTYDGLDRQVSHRDPNASSTTTVHYDGLSTTPVMEDIPTKAETLYALTPAGRRVGLTYAGSSSSVQ